MPIKKTPALTALPPRKPESLTVVQARRAVNTAADAFELARAAYAAAGARLQQAQDALAAAQAAK